MMVPPQVEAVAVDVVDYMWQPEEWEFGPLAEVEA